MWTKDSPAKEIIEDKHFLGQKQMYEQDFWSFATNSEVFLGINQRIISKLEWVQLEQV